MKEIMKIVTEIQKQLENMHEKNTANGKTMSQKTRGKF